MSERDRNAISARLWLLPRQLLLALINATAILVIAAAILVLVVMARIDHFAGRVVGTMSEAVLAKVDLPPKEVLANLRNLTEEMRTLNNALREIRTEENPRLQPEIARLREALTAVHVSVDRLGSARSTLTEAAIGQLGQTVTDALMKLRDCPAKVGRASPHG